MNGRTIEFVRSARKELEGLDAKIQDRILAAIEGMSADPWPPGCKKLKGEKSFRIRVGSYRVIYEVSKDVVLINRVRHRKDAYL